jgi:hypothetical protein
MTVRQYLDFSKSLQMEVRGLVGRGRMQLGMA